METTGMNSFILGYCKCGCKQEIDIFDKYHYRLKKFVHGHNATGIHKPGLKAEKHPNWKGGRCMHGNGYFLIHKPEHHFVDTRGYVFEHRYVWEQHNNAILLPWAIVHHKNHIRTDNAIENLEIFDAGKHSIHHLKEKRDRDINKRKCAYCGKGTRQRLKRCHGYVYYLFEWTRNELNKSEWLCAKCYRNQYRKLHGRKS